jgi:hypothetical protein
MSMKGLGPGLLAAATVGALQLLTRKLMQNGPRIDELGERMFEAAFERIGRRPPRAASRAMSWALGNVGSDTLLFALVATGQPRRPFVRGALVGAATGVAAVVLPSRLGLPARLTAKDWRTGLTTFGFYLAAGLSAAGVVHLGRQLEAGSGQA